MTRQAEPLLRTVLLSAIGLLGLAAVLALIGARINTTPSIPLGLYWTSSAPVARGNYVQLCPPRAAIFELARARGVIAAGLCPGGYGFLMKRILAVGLDRVTLSQAGVVVNGQLLPYSAIPVDDPELPRWPRYPLTHMILKSDQVLVMSDRHPRSFDSRYFGPLQLTQIRSVIVPVITW